MLRRQLTLGEIAEIAGGSLEGDGSRQVSGLSELSLARDGHLTYYDGRQPSERLIDTPAACVLLPPACVLINGHSVATGAGLALIRCDAPHQAFLKIGLEIWRREVYREPGIHPLSVIHAEARIGRGVSIGAFVTVDAGAELGDGVCIHAGARIGAGAQIGAGSSIGGGVSIGAGVTLGSECCVYDGAIIGFAYRPGMPGEEDDQAPSPAGVRIGNRVQIGPNTVIESGETRPTRIEDGARIGELCVIGHDSVVGEGARVGAMSGLAGNSEVGTHAVLFGQVGVSSRTQVGPFATVLAKSGVSRSVPAHAVYGGIPARPRGQWRNAINALYKLPRLIKRIQDLEATLTLSSAGHTRLDS